MSNGECTAGPITVGIFDFTFREDLSDSQTFCYEIKGQGEDIPEDKDLSNWQLGFDCTFQEFANLPTPTCTVQVGNGPIETTDCDPVPPSENQSGVTPSFKFDTNVGKLPENPAVIVCIQFPIELERGCVDISYKGGEQTFQSTEHIIGPSCANVPSLECPVANPQTCCQEVIEFKTQLVPPVIDNSDFMGLSSQFEIVGTPVIESVCPEKVIVCGKVRKTYTYMAAFDDGCFGEQQLVDERPFQCVIDRDDANEGDTFAVVGAAVLCEGVPVLQNFGTKTILVDGGETVVDVAWKVSEKDIIKVCIRKVIVEPS